MYQDEKNPILPGFNPDPCICRKGDDYYIAVTSFEWFPGIPIYCSQDMKHWELCAHALQSADEQDLKKLPSAKGIWAPCLTYCEAEDLFYVVYGVMNSMNARYFDTALRLQKAGHASYVETPGGEVWLVYHASRPFLPELCCTLGRETCIQRARWTEDGWLRVEGDGLPLDEVGESALPEWNPDATGETDDFDTPGLREGWYAPRINPKSFSDLTARPGWMRLRGQESACPTSIPATASLRARS